MHVHRGATADMKCDRQVPASECRNVNSDWISLIGAPSPSTRTVACLQREDLIHHGDALSVFISALHHITLSLISVEIKTHAGPFSTQLSPLVAKTGDSSFTHRKVLYVGPEKTRHRQK